MPWHAAIAIDTKVGQVVLHRQLVFGASPQLQPQLQPQPRIQPQTPTTTTTTKDDEEDRELEFARLHKQLAEMGPALGARINDIQEQMTTDLAVMKKQFGVLLERSAAEAQNANGPARARGR